MVVYKFKSISDKPNRGGDLLAYSKSIKRICSIVKSNRIWLSRISELNDVDEGVFFYPDSCDSGVLKQCLKEKQEMIVFSASKGFASIINTLMWAHYANAHKGLAIEFKLKYPYLRNMHCRWGGVKYYDFTQFLHGWVPSNLDITEVCNKYGDGFAFSKSSLWKYEREWRILAYDASHKKGLECEFVGCVSRVVLGCAMSDVVRKDICKELKGYEDIIVDEDAYRQEFLGRYRKLLLAFHRMNNEVHDICEIENDEYLIDG